MVVVGKGTISMNNLCNVVRVAHVTKFLKSNGITNVIFNYSFHIDKKHFKSTVIAGSPILEIYKKKCKNNGIDLIELPSKDKASIGYYISLLNAFRENKYDIVHIHGNSATITIELLLAKVSGIKNVIVHCHNSTCDHLIAHKLLSPIIKCLYTKGYACSNLAGDFMFGNKPYTVLTNGFEINKFVYNQQKRELLRQNLNFENKFVIGNVARFNNQKNHIFLLQIFEQVASVNQNAVLFLVGAGPLLSKIQQLIEVHPFRDRIVYYGETDHVEDLYNIMDVFVLPSRYEGLGIVFIEAQINGLECITSDQVPAEVNINNQTRFLSLKESAEVWASEICRVSISNRKSRSEIAYRNAKNYDINASVTKLETDYLELLL